MSKQLSSGERTDIERILGIAEAHEIKAVEANDPDWKQRVNDRLNKIAVSKLKIDKEAAELAKVESELQRLERRREDLQITIARKMPLGPRSRHSCPARLNMCTAIAEIVTKLSTAEQLRDVTGGKIASIKDRYRKRREKLAACSTREEAVVAGVLSK